MTKQADHDPFEEFEFKPLTEGLGFHRRENSSNDSSGQPVAPSAASNSRFATKPETAFDIPSLEKSGKEKSRIETPRRKTEKSNEQNLAQDLLDLGSLEPKDLDKPLLKTPLLKKQSPATKIDDKPASTEKVDEVIKTFQSRQWDFRESGEKARTSLKSPPEVVYGPSGYDLSALVLDSMLIVASFLGCLILLLMITQVDLVATVTTASPLTLALSGTALLFGVCFVYLTINRLFLGATPGEWVFDQRLGAPNVQGRASFSLKVVARGLFILATGLILFPLISLIRGRDVLGGWMGLELHQKTLR